jgi:SRSO17 transposase
MAAGLDAAAHVRAAGFSVTAVVGDTEFGDNATLRRTLHRAQLPYALGVSSDLKVFLGTPALEAPPLLIDKGRPRDASARLARRATTRPRSLVAVRTGTRGWRPRPILPVDLPPTASLRTLVSLAHQRWAIEQQYQELKDEIGLDHFEGRSLPGWQRHVVLTAIAYSFLQIERRRRGQTHLTLLRVCAVIQEVLTAHFFMTQPNYLKWMLKLKDVEITT